jgi:hypothetical protein
VPGVLALKEKVLRRKGTECLNNTLTVYEAEAEEVERCEENRRDKGKGSEC